MMMEGGSEQREGDLQPVKDALLTSTSLDGTINPEQIGSASNKHTSPLFRYEGVGLDFSRKWPELCGSCR